MTVDLVLENAKLYLPTGVTDAGIAIEGERIVKIAKDANLPSASKKINIRGHMVLPGLIDTHVHLRDQELAYKEDFYSGTAAAASGGVTSAVDMPNSKPVTMSVESLKERMRIAEEKSVVNVGFFSAFPSKTEEVPQIIRNGGALAFKFFMSQQVGGVNPEDEEAVLSMMKEAAKTGVPVAVHAEDSRILRKNKIGLEESESLVDYLKVHSPKAEAEAVKDVIQWSKKTNVQIHFCHISTAKGIAAISKAKADGMSVTCEVTPQHLLLSSHDLMRIGATALADPPEREPRDISVLWASLRRGVVDVIASDHAPHTAEEKGERSIWRVKTGISGLETMLPLLLTEVNRGSLDLSTLVRATSENPSRILHIKGRDGLKEGNYADLVVVDLKKEYKIDVAKFHSKAKHSPFDGWKVQGKPTKTFVNGRIIMDEGEILAKPGSGGIIRWGS